MSQRLCRCCSIYQPALAAAIVSAAMPGRLDGQRRYWGDDLFLLFSRYFSAPRHIAREPRRGARRCAMIKSARPPLDMPVPTPAYIVAGRRAFASGRREAGGPPRFRLFQARAGAQPGRKQAPCRRHQPPRAPAAQRGTTNDGWPIR